VGARAKTQVKTFKKQKTFSLSRTASLVQEFCRITALGYDFKGGTQRESPDYHDAVDAL